MTQPTNFLAKRGKKRPEDVRFWEKVNKNGPVPPGRPDLGPCWLWLGSLADGYGQFGGTIKRAHRWTWIHEYGPVPDGLELDHLCRVRACCNPAHLEPVTRRENMLRGETFAAAAASATHCKRGHPFDEANTIIVRGNRNCRTCNNERARIYRERKRNTA